MNTHDLDALLDDIARINPYYQNALGGHAPGMGGISAASIGTNNAAVEVIASLKRDAGLFAALVTAPRRNEAKLKTVMETIEGGLMTLSVLSRITDTCRDSILNRMQDIAKNPNPRK